MKRTPPTLAAALAVVLLAADAAADERADAVFFESLDVNLVQVEVYVTGRDGAAVAGLTADDFEVFEDGRPMTISNFYAVEEGRPVSPEPAVAPLAVPPGAPPAALPAASPPVPEDQRLHLIVYFDNLQMRPFNRNRVAREVRAFLAAQVRPDDRVMVVTFERSLHVRQPFTADLHAAFAALEGTEKLTGFAVQAATERDQLLRRLETTDDLALAEPEVEFYAKSVHRDVTDSIDALKELVGSLGGLPGRKALLYVSDGIAMTAADDLFHVLDNRFGVQSTGKLTSMRYSARNDFRELVARANANRVTFYTLDAAGLRGHSSLSAERGASGAGGSYAEADFVRDSNLSEPLQMMALDTGGQAAFNTNNFAGALRRMAEDFRSYYSLGYLPAHSGDGRYHTIEVEVKRRGVEVRHRSGYRDKTLEARLGEGALAALLHGVGVDPFDVRLVLGRARPRDDGYYLVPLEVRIPLGRVTLVPQGDLFRGQLHVVVAVLDREGGTSPPEPTPIPLAVPAAEIETARGKDFVYAVELLTRPGEHEVAVGVRDELGGETAFVRRGFSVGR
jgi:VWFA-related protein